MFSLICGSRLKNNDLSVKGDYLREEPVAGAGGERRA
jgi:hypothetical protein